MEKLKETYGDRIEFIGVNVWINEKREKIDRYLGDLNFTVTSVIDFDSSMSRSYGIFATPTQIVVDRRGVVRYIDPRVPEDIDEHMEELLN